jgi:hypothetical protein
MKICDVCGKQGCVEWRGADYHAGKSYGSLKCDYKGTPPFADAEWKDDPTMCQWCAGTGFPHADESYVECECPGVQSLAKGDTQ